MMNQNFSLREALYTILNIQIHIFILGKIFKIEKNTKEEEKNINTALLLDPKNEEAMYILIDLELERSNFSKVQDLKKDFKKICNTLCEKLTSIDTRLKDFEKKDAS